MMNFTIKPQADFSTSSNTALVLAFQNHVWSAEGITIDERIFSGKKNEVYLHVVNQRLLIFVGLGETRQGHEISKMIRSAVFKHKKHFKNHIDVLLPADLSNDLNAAVSNGISLGFYASNYFKTDEKEDSKTVDHIVFYGNGTPGRDIQKGLHLAKAQKTCMQLVDLPPNTVTPEYMAQESIRVGALPQVSVEIWNREQCEKEQLHAFLSVARAAEVEPQWIKIEYKPNRPRKHLGLVGKGITFDTGGLNIKTQGMVHMKCDMAGGAAVIGLLEYAALEQLPVQITAIVPATENTLDQKSYRPSDVISSYSGKTIEIIDTDAEGRLIMADALSFISKNYSPDFLIDIATLTGSSVGTFGYVAGALFSSSEALQKQLFDAGIQSGEKLWALPLWEEYVSDIHSDIADVRNYSGKPLAGAISAAKFLEYFTEKHPSWAHIDMAGVSFVDNEFSKSKNATAFGVHLLANFLENL